MKRSLVVPLVLLTVVAPLALAGVSNAHGGPHSTVVAQRNGAVLRSQLALAQHDQASLAAARPDERDLNDLTRRLKLHLHTPINPYVRSSAPNYAVGRVDTFYVAQATSGYFQMKAMLMLKTAHANWYVDLNSSIPRATLLSLLHRSANDFETHVYPTDHRAFGQEWTPGIDHDPRITVLCAATLPGAGGYYSAEDLYPRAVNHYSNQRKMLYVNIGVSGYPLGTDGFASTIAHEFQHMIHWFQHERDDTWINEGASMLAQVLNGYTADELDRYFATVPGTQLDTFCEPSAYGCTDSASTASYGVAFQWMLYFYQRYGGDRALRTLLADKSLSGMTLFDDVLARLGSHDRSRDMFRKWVIANFVDDPQLAGGAYGYQPIYQGCCIHASLTASTGAYPYTRQGRVNQYATDYIELRPAGASTLRLRFAGDPTVHIVPNTPLGASEWWSNRGDEMDSTLTRSVDLSRVRHATLQYDIWYAVEKDFDYGYVEVSTDGGSTWYTQRGQHTTNVDPNGANYGHGYTGFSSQAAGNRAGWIHERVDLSHYAGRRILIRFEHITDDAFNLHGLALDTIRIPEIGFADGPAAGGWTAHGWTRVANLLPTHWIVQEILYTRHGIEIHPVAISPDGAGQATIGNVGGDVERVVLAISPTAPQTTIASNYTVTVR